MTKRLNRAKCGICKDVIKSIHRHDFVSCKCGNIFVDGGNDYWRCGAKDITRFYRYVNREWIPVLLDKTWAEDGKNKLKNWINKVCDKLGIKKLIGE